MKRRPSPISWRNFLAALLAAATLAAPGALQAARDDRWTEIRSPHFDLFTDGDEAGGSDLVHYFEQVRSFFQQAFGLGGRGRMVRIVCFRSPRQFQYYETSKIAAAVFHPGALHDYILIRDDQPGRREVAVHEYTHLVVRSTNHDLPVWLDEGLAEVYSNLEPHGSFVVVGRVLPARAQSLARGPWIGLRALVSATRSSEIYNQQSDAEMFYAESWALVHMLALDNAYSSRLKNLMDALLHGGSVEAFQKTYGKPIEQVEADLQTYLDQSRLNAAVFQVRLEADPAPTVTLRAGLPARLALAEELMDYPGRAADAQAAFNRLLHDYPQSPEAEQGMAEFLLHEHRAPEAAAHFARADLLGDRDATMYLEYGRTLAAANRPADAVAVLRKSLALAPSLDAAHFELAILLVKTARFSEALDEFHAVRRLPPVDAPRYYYNLAYANFQLGDLDRARRFAAQTRDVAANPTERQEVDRLTQDIEARSKQ